MLTHLSKKFLSRMVSGFLELLKNWTDLLFLFVLMDPEIADVEFVDLYWLSDSKKRYKCIVLKVMGQMDLSKEKQKKFEVRHIVNGETLIEGSYEEATQRQIDEVNTTAYMSQDEFVKAVAS
ncbi:hypothetical protein DITRI_Ditri14bG0150400 [Diplodiscus trichospermus]